MRRFLTGIVLGGLAALILPAASTALGQELERGSGPEIFINVDAQKLYVVRKGLSVLTFPISTSKFGLGDTNHSYKTPLGRFKVCSKTGEALPMGAVLKGGRFTGEVLAPNAPGRDPIVTRIIRLQGLEEQNRRAFSRGIYIHGTPEERNIGKPVSWGCIRMRSKDVVELYRHVDVGTSVTITSRNAGAYKPAAALATTKRQKEPTRHLVSR